MNSHSLNISGLKARHSTAWAGAEPREAEAQVAMVKMMPALKGRNLAGLLRPRVSPLQGWAIFVSAFPGAALVLLASPQAVELQAFSPLMP